MIIILLIGDTVIRTQILNRRRIHWEWILEKTGNPLYKYGNRAVVLIQLHKQKILVNNDEEFLRSENLHTLQLICQSGPVM
jgi:hypothetical protein